MLQNAKAFLSEDRHYKRCTWTTLKQIHAFYMPYDNLNMFYETCLFMLFYCFHFKISFILYVLLCMHFIGVIIVVFRIYKRFYACFDFNCLTRLSSNQLKILIIHLRHVYALNTSLRRQWTMIASARPGPRFNHKPRYTEVLSINIRIDQHNEIMTSTLLVKYVRYV